MRAAEAIISGEPLKALGAALLGIVVPLFRIVTLFVTIVGDPHALALLIGVWPLAAFVGYLVSGIWIGDWVLRRASPGVVRERPYGAAILGVFVLELIALIPFLGFIAWLFGYGPVTPPSDRGRPRSLPR